MESHATRPILVAYASKQGSTREVAEFIGGVLADHGCRAAIREAADVRDLGPYRGVVLGGSIYVGRWHPHAIGFLERHGDALAGLPLAIFALGPRSLAEADVAKSRAQLDSSLAKAPDTTPAAVAIFGGVVDPTKLRCPFNRLPASDARDWVAIRAWADEAAALFDRQALSV